MTWDEAIEILFGEPIEVDAGAFADPHEPTGTYIRAEVRFPRNKWGQVNGGWADILGETIFVTPETSEGRYVPVTLVRRPEESDAARVTTP